MGSLGLVNDQIRWPDRILLVNDLFVVVKIDTNQPQDLSPGAQGH